jgi:hypothetical protein
VTPPWLHGSLGRIFLSHALALVVAMLAGSAYWKPRLSAAGIWFEADKSPAK